MPLPLSYGFNEELLTRWARYYWRTEEYDRLLPHRIVCGEARVHPQYRGASTRFAHRVRDQENLLWANGPERRHCQRLTHEGIGRLLEELEGA
jgi:hypothetical protein